VLVNFRLFPFVCAFVLFAALGVQSGPAAAKDKFPNYLVDILLERCMSSQVRGGHAVFAFSPIETSFCSHGTADLSTHRKLALERCARQIPAGLRSKIKCSIVVVDRKVVDRSLLSKSRKDIGAPAIIEIFDGETGTIQKRRGIVSTGRYVSLTHQAARITLDDGKLLCEGFRIDRSNSRGFEGKCFGTFEFKGTLPSPSGVFLYQGNYVAKISFKLKKGKSYIKVTTGE
jgi:hypothetical protein